MYMPKPFPTVKKKSTKSDLILVRKGLTSFFNSSRCVNTFLRGRNLTSEAGYVVMGRCLGDPVKQCISPTLAFLTIVLFPWLLSPRGGGGEVIK